MNYMKNPRVMAGQPVQMQFRGINDFDVRVDIIHYLKTLNFSNSRLQDDNTSSRETHGWGGRLWKIWNDDRKDYNVGGAYQDAGVYSKEGRVSK